MDDTRADDVIHSLRNWLHANTSPSTPRYVIDADARLRKALLALVRPERNDDLFKTSSFPGDRED